MKKFFSALASILFGLVTTVKKNDPVQWRFLAKKEGGATYSLNFMAIIQPPWSLYVEKLNSFEGTLFTIDFEPNIYVIFKEGLHERGTPIQYHDFIFNDEVRLYKGSVNFVQLVKIIIDEPVTINGTVYYMVGDGIDMMKTYKKTFVMTLND